MSKLGFIIGVMKSLPFWAGINAGMAVWNGLEGRHLPCAVNAGVAVLATLGALTWR
jgi:type III secretory pathway component EscT